MVKFIFSRSTHKESMHPFTQRSLPLYLFLSADAKHEWCVVWCHLSELRETHSSSNANIRVLIPRSMFFPCPAVFHWLIAPSNALGTLWLTPNNSDISLFTRPSPSRMIGDRDWAAPNHMVDRLNCRYQFDYEICEAAIHRLRFPFEQPLDWLVLIA